MRVRARVGASQKSRSRDSRSVTRIEPQMGTTSRRTLRDLFIGWMIRLLVKEHRGYRQRSPNDLEALRAKKAAARLRISFSISRLKTRFWRSFPTFGQASTKPAVVFV